MKNRSNWQLIQLNGTEKRLKQQFDRIGADSYAFQMWGKGCGFAAKVAAMPCGAANILKQEALASGADAIVSRGAVNCSIEFSDAVILGSVHDVRILAGRLLRQPFGLVALGHQLEQMLERTAAGAVQDKLSGEICIRDNILLLDKIYVMGILNITPDSFSDGGRYMTQSAALDRAKQIIGSGAAFIDIGAVSTRPGYELPSVAEEIGRLDPVMEAVAKLASDNGVYLSLDSWRAEVVEKFLPMVDVVNDQSGMADNRLAVLAASHKCAYCMMHNPQKAEESDPAVYLYHKALMAESAGLKPNQIILDPGFGFGKDVSENYQVLRNLPELVSLGYPVLAGVSRKSMIGAAVSREPKERIHGTIAAETLAAAAGAAIIRTHDVAACVDAMNVVRLYRLEK